jgi:hypothetical protein
MLYSLCIAKETYYFAKPAKIEQINLIKSLIKNHFGNHNYGDIAINKLRVFKRDLVQEVMVWMYKDLIADSGDKDIIGDVESKQKIINLKKLALNLFGDDGFLDQSVYPYHELVTPGHPRYTELKKAMISRSGTYDKFFNPNPPIIDNFRRNNEDRPYPLSPFAIIEHPLYEHGIWPQMMLFNLPKVTFALDEEIASMAKDLEGIIFIMNLKESDEKKEFFDMNIAALRQKYSYSLLLTKIFDLASDLFYHGYIPVERKERYHTSRAEKFLPLLYPEIYNSDKQKTERIINPNTIFRVYHVITPEYKSRVLSIYRRQIVEINQLLEGYDDQR